MKVGAGLVEAREGRHRVCMWEGIIFVEYELGMVTR